MEFKRITEYFARIEQATSRLEMTDLFCELLQEAPVTDTARLVYFAQGALGPDFSAPELGLGEKLVEQAIARATGYGVNEVHAQFRETGDLGLAAERLCGKKKQHALFSEQLSLAKVFANLNRITTATGSGSQDAKLKLLAELLNSATATEARYIVRAVIGKLRLGIGDPSIMDALAILTLPEFRKQNKKMEEELRAQYQKDEDVDRQLKMRSRQKIEDAYNIHPDLGEIARMLKEQGLQGLKKTSITPGMPIRPTLAERLSSAEEIVEKLGMAAVEAKYDGLRLQVHKSGNTITLFSRAQENMTPMFPEIVAGIREQVAAEEAVIEGEALAVNEQTGEYFPFQTTMQRKRKHGIGKKAEEFPLKLFVFDLMFLDGKNCMELPFRDRRKLLEKTIMPGNVIELTESVVTSDPKKVIDFFERCVERGLEGIIAKDLNAKYIAGARKFAWIKLKRSYKSTLDDTLDTVIIGYYAGKGKRKQFGLGALLVAVYNKASDCFESIAKIGTGLSEKQLAEFEARLKKERSAKKPLRVVCELQPDYWVTPTQVIEVLADEITRSPLHAAGKENDEGYALRFPRLIRERFDKKPEQATTTEEIKALFARQKHVQPEAAT